MLTSMDSYEEQYIQDFFTNVVFFFYCTIKEKEQYILIFWVGPEVSSQVLQKFSGQTKEKGKTINHIKSRNVSDPS